MTDKVKNLVAQEQSEITPAKKRGRPRKSDAAKKAEQVAQAEAADAELEAMQATEEDPEWAESEEMQPKASRKHADLKEAMADTADYIFIEKLTQAIRDDVQTLTRFDLRNLTKLYHAYQQMRIRTFNQFGATVAAGEEQSATFAYLANNMLVMEKRIEQIMDVWSKTHPVGRWLRSIYGVGPVFAASLIGYVDLDKANSAAQVWSFAGLSPTQKRQKGERCNWNADLKCMCYLIADSLVRCGKTHPDRYIAKNEAWNKKHPDNPHYISREEIDAVRAAYFSDSNMYCRLYRQRRAFEEQNNQKLLYADQAKALLTSKRFESENALEWLKKGMLTPGHIDARAKRYAVKMLLAHLFDMLHEGKYGEKPLPYAIAHLEHVDIIPCPNYDEYIEDIRAARDIL